MSLGSPNSAILSSAAIRGHDEEIPACVPVVRQPGEAKTSDHMSSIGSR